MVQLLKTVSKVKINDNIDSFQDYIVITSDSLLIINKQLELVEWIIEGNDNDGIYLSADDEDMFLDAISRFKKEILLGNNPKLLV